VTLAGRRTGPQACRAPAELVRRHGTLRTAFTTQEGVPAQVIRQPGESPLPLVDLSGLPGEEREAEAAGLATADAAAPFDLAGGPLIRARLLRLSPSQHLLPVTLHHMISDGWSASVPVRELSAPYSAYARGEEARLPERPVRYVGYAVWQRE
jgi:hypothetical protein